MNKIKKGDTVKVMRGKDAGKVGEIISVVNDLNGKTEKVVIAGVNVVKKSQKANAQLGIAGGISQFEKPISVSNVMFVDPKTNEATRVGFKMDEKTGKKVRFAKKSGEVLK